MPKNSAASSYQPTDQEIGAVDGNSSKAADRFQIFEAVALERLQTGSDTTKPAAFLPLPMRLAAISAAVIAGMGIVWSILAKIPVQVDGIGAFVPSNGMGSLIAATSGTLNFQVSGLAPSALPAEVQQQNKVLSLYWRNQVRKFTSEVDQVDRLRNLVNIALSKVQGQALLLQEDFKADEVIDQPGRRHLVTYPEGTLLARIADPMANQELNSALLGGMPMVDLQRKLKIDHIQRSGQYRNLGKLTSEQRLVVSRELQQRRNLFLRMQKLWKQGFISETQLLDAKGRVNQLENQLLDTDSSRLSIDINSLNEVRQSNQANITDIETRNKVEDQLIHYLGKTASFVPEGGFYLLTQSYRDGSYVRQGDELMTYSTKPPELPVTIPVFLDGISSQQVDAGNKVLVTPKGISRAEYGGIPGQVVKVIQLPLPAEGVIGAVGSRSLATAITKLLPTQYLVIIKLEKDEPKYCKQALSYRCYRWSSGRLPPHPVRLGTLADVQITTVYRRPVDFVMPALRKALGMVVDNQEAKKK